MENENMNLDGVKRLRWIKVKPKANFGPTTYGDDTTPATNQYTSSSYRWTTSLSGQASGASSPCTNDDCTANGQQVIVLRRLLKPEYWEEAISECSSIYSEYNAHTGAQCFWEIDEKIWIDMSDHTMWLAVDYFNSVEDFFKSLVENDLDHGKWHGYDVDDKPSFGLVRLKNLISTFVSWWCR